MTPRIHFIAGLPRAGSTLLAGLLRQNPRVHAAMTGPVGGLVGSALNTMSAHSETSVFLDEDKRRAILRAIVDAYYADQADKALIFDTNRGWAARLPLIRALFPEARLLCCVRSVAWVMDSFERLVRRNAFEPSKLFTTPEERATVFSRTEALAHRDRVVGFAYSALKEAYYGEHSGYMLLVDYDILAQKPEACLKLVYRFLEEEWFPHDVDNVEYDEPEFDRKLGAPGLHRVSGPVQHRPRQTVLPPDVFKRFDQFTFWHDPTGSAAWRIVPEAATQPAAGSVPTAG